MLDVGRLRALLAMSEHGGSSGAARALGRPVAGELADWERELGLSLVDGDQLTPAGRRLAEHAGILLGQLEAAESDAAAVAGRVAGTLRLGVGADAGRVLLADTLATLRSTDLRLSIRQLPPGEERVAALDGTLDAVVVGEYGAAVPHPLDAGVERRELFTEPLLLAVPGRHRAAGASVRLAELAGEDWILATGDTRVALERAAAGAGFAPRVVAEVGEDALALTLVAAGLGVALLPASAAPSPAEGVRLLTVLDGGLRRTVVAAVRRTRAADPAVWRLLDALAAAARRVAAAVPGVTAAITPVPAGPARRPDPLFDPLPPEPTSRDNNGRRDPWADRARPEGPDLPGRSNGAPAFGPSLFGSDLPGAPADLPGSTDFRGRAGSPGLPDPGAPGLPGAPGGHGRNGVTGQPERNGTDLPGFPAADPLPPGALPPARPGPRPTDPLSADPLSSGSPPRGGPADAVPPPGDPQGHRNGTADPFPPPGDPQGRRNGTAEAFPAPGDPQGRRNGTAYPAAPGGGPSDLPRRGGSPTDFPGPAPAGREPAGRSGGAAAEPDDLAGMSGLSGFSGRPARGPDGGPDGADAGRGPGLPGRATGASGLGPADAGALPPPGALPGREPGGLPAPGAELPTRGGASPYRTPAPTGDAPEFTPDLPGRSGPNPYRPDSSAHPTPDPFRTTGTDPGPNPYRAGQPRRDSAGGSELFTAGSRPGAALPPPGGDARPATGRRSRGGDGAEGTLPPAPAGAADDVRLSIFEDLQSEWFVQREGGAKAESWQMAADDGWAAAARLAEPTTAGTTTAGLPRRRPQAMVVPGAVGGPNGAEGQSGPTHRSPQEVRGRLSSYRDGVRRGRHAQRPAEEE